MAIVVHRVERDLRIGLRDRAHLPAADPETPLGHTVEEIWLEEQQQRRTLTNGTILCRDGFDGATLWTRRTDYRHFIAQLRSPDLRPQLGITALGVSGLLHDAEKVVFGLRSSHTTQHPGEWELVPSGGLSAEAIRGTEVSAVDQILLELAEEVGIGSDSVVSAAPFAIVEDEASNVVDIAVDLEVASWTVVRKPTAEYDRLEWVATSEVSHFTRDRPIVPVSRVLLELRGYLVSRSYRFA